MRQGIIGGLLVVGGVILSPFGPQVLGGAKTLCLMVLSVMFSSGSYAWTLWTHGGSGIFLWFFLGIVWAIFLVDAVLLLVVAVFFAMTGAIILTLRQKRDTRIDFGEFVSLLRYSCITFSLCLFCLYLASLVDVVIGAWTTKPSFLTEDTYNSLFFWGVKGYLYAYPLSMVVAGLYLLMESCRKWGQSMLRG